MSTQAIKSTKVVKTKGINRGMKVMTVLEKYTNELIDETKDYFIIYRTNLPKNKKYYGLHKVTPKNKNTNYWGSGIRLKEWIKLNGTSQLTQDILFRTHNKQLAMEVENSILEEIFCYTSVLNINRGSAGNYTLDNDAYLRRGANISAAKTGVPRTEKTKQKISNSRKGKMLMKNTETGEITLRCKSDLDNITYVSLNKGKKYNKKHKNNVK